MYFERRTNLEGIAQAVRDDDIATFRTIVKRDPEVL